MMTGTNPGRHGIFDFVLPRRGTYGRRMASAADRRCPPVWVLANQGGLTSGVINVPTTYPADQVQGYLLAGMMGAPRFEPSAVWPESLFPELQKAIGDFVMDPVKRTTRGYSLAALDAQVANREQTFNYLLEHHPTDLFIGVVNYTDHVEHWFFGDRALDSEGRHIEDMILYGYQAADRLLGQVLDHCGPETHVLVVSDHGAGPLPAYLNIDRLLVECGLLRFRAGATAAGESGSLKKLARLMPDWLRNALPKRLRRRALEKVRQEYEGEIDWSRTKVFRRSSGFGLELNVEGREPGGIIPAADYEQERTEIIATLAEATVKYPQLGECVFYRREELYHGPQLSLAPDIVMAPSDFAVETTSSPHPEAGVVLTTPEMHKFDAPKRFKIGSHRLQGVFIAAGPRIQGGSKPHLAELADVTPTVLELLGCPPPEGLDGRVLAEIIK